MVNSKQVRDNDSTELGGNDNSVKKSKSTGEPIIEVTHTNAPLLTVKYLELCYLELVKLNKRFEDANG